MFACTALSYLSAFVVLDSDGVGGEPIEAVHYNSETLGNMQTQLFYRFPSKALQVYVLLYQKMPAARPKSTLLGSTLSAARDMGGLVTRAMIITSTHIILATEDYSRYATHTHTHTRIPQRSCACRAACACRILFCLVKSNSFFSFLFPSADGRRCTIPPSSRRPRPSSRSPRRTRSPSWSR